ncbi:MAG: tetratricopeptide repeat protein [Candidatus Melainabacteria bacterium]|nr:tetratricopeptide repeat protein [Candidatus Melainabacteria bacterium]
MKKDLSPLCRSFVVQGLRYTLGGLALLSIPFLTYARAATLNFSFLGGALDAQIVVVLLYVFVVLHGILFASLGPLILFGGLAYVRRAQELLDSSNAIKVLLDLKLRTNKISLNGGTLLDGIVTYADGSQENFKLVFQEKSALLKNLIAQSTQVDLFGEPKSNPKPRILSTPCGLLLEQPNELGLLQSIFGFGDKSKFLVRRVKIRLMSLTILSLAYGAFLSPFSLNLAMFPAQAKPILSITVFASMFLLFADLWESKKLARLNHALEKVDCQFTLLKRGLVKWLHPKIVTVNVVFQDGRPSQKSSLLLESFNKVSDGEPMYGSAYLGSNGRVIGIVNGATSLVKSKVAYWTIAPMVLYLVTMPFCVSLMQPNMSKEYTFNSGEEYYQQGLMYKAYGRTEKARSAMLAAQNFDARTKLKAQIYIKTHLPLDPVSKEAEQMNIKGYNLMASRRTADAIKAFKNCIAEYPHFEWPYGNLGSLYIKLQEFDKAKFYLEQAVAINPDYVNALQHLAELELRQGHRQEALGYLERISIADPHESKQVELQKIAIKASL